MSLQEGLIEGEAQSGHEDTHGGPTESLAEEDYSGVLGRIRRHVDIWAGKYVEMQVEARTGRNR